MDGRCDHSLDMASADFGDTDDVVDRHRDGPKDRQHMHKIRDETRLGDNKGPHRVGAGARLGTTLPEPDRGAKSDETRMTEWIQKSDEIMKSWTPQWNSTPTGLRRRCASQE